MSKGGRFEPVTQAPQQLEERLARHSRRHGAGTKAPEILVVASRGRLTGLFAAARERLHEGPIRIVGHGVTLEREWPEWLSGAQVTLTELGAYRCGSVVDDTAPLRKAIRSYIDACFGSATDTRPAEVFFAGACARLVQQELELVSAARGIAASKPKHLYFADPDDPLVGLLSPRPQARLRSAVRSVRLAAYGALMIAASGAKNVVDTHAASTSRRALATRRKLPVDGGTLWAALVPDWERMNRHVVEAAARPAQAHGALAGVLLFGTLAPGAREERALRSRTASPLWPGLAQLDTRSLPVDQIVGDESVLAALRELPGDIAACAQVLRAILTHPSVVSDAGLTLDLAGDTKGLAKLASVDVFRARAADRAVRALAARRRMEGQAVVFVGCSTPGAASAVAALRRAGATSVDFLHGAGWDNAYGHAESPADVVVAWTEPDRAVFERLGSRSVVQAGMPLRPMGAPSGRGGTVRRVLLLSNYCHRDSRHTGFPRLAFQGELLRVAELMAAHGPDFQFTWRPHPADDLEEVHRALAGAPGLRLALEGTLAEAIADCDLVVSSLSTSVFEALFSERPVFVQVPPEWEAAEVYSFLDPARCFFRAAEGVAVLRSFLENGSLAPEAASRRALFGVTERPHPFVLSEIATRRGRSVQTTP